MSTFCRRALFQGVLAGALGVLSASASSIPAPAAILTSLPEANPTLHLTSSLAITFPFNIIGW